MHGYPNHIEKLLAWFRARKYEGGSPWHITPRKIEFYEFVVRKEVEEQVIEDIAYFARPQSVKGVIKLFQKVFRFLPLKDKRKMRMIDLEKYEGKAAEKKSISPDEFILPSREVFWAYAYPIAVINDMTGGRGEELV